jgi:hypothetical protein
MSVYVTEPPDFTATFNSTAPKERKIRHTNVRGCHDTMHRQSQIATKDQPKDQQPEEKPYYSGQ